MITMHEAETILRTRVHGAGGKVVEASLPNSAVCAMARPADLTYVVVDTRKPSSWLHAHEMLRTLSDAERERLLPDLSGA